MGERTGIEWTDSTWSPFAGCSRVSPECVNCYAERLAPRLQANGIDGFADVVRSTPDGPRWTGVINSRARDTWLWPLQWRRPRRIFVNSQSDTFHERASDELIESVFAIAALAPQHTFQILTKRADRMDRWFNEPLPLENRELQVLRAAEALGQALWGKPGAPFAFDSRGSAPENYYRATREQVVNRRKWPGWPLPNVWLGVSVGLQEYTSRIHPLLASPAVVRFLSCEPLLGPLDLTAVRHQLRGESFEVVSVLKERDELGRGRPRNRVGWVIVGGESGAGARPMHPDWARSLRDQCATAGVPFFFKQWGEFAPQKLGDNPPRWGLHMERVGKKSAGALLDGVEHKAFPEVRA